MKGEVGLHRFARNPISLLIFYNRVLEPVIYLVNFIRLPSEHLMLQPYANRLVKKT